MSWNWLWLEFIWIALARRSVDKVSILVAMVTILGKGLNNVRTVVLLN